MSITLLAGVEVEVDAPPLPAVAATVPVDLIASVTAPTTALVLESPSAAPSVVEVPPSDLLVVPVAGAPGADGDDGAPAGQYEYLMPWAQTTVLVDHPLGYDPVAVQVFVDGELCAEYQVTFTVPGQQVRLGFDIPVQALIRLM